MCTGWVLRRAERSFMDIIKVLTRLVTAPGVTGFEDDAGHGDGASAVVADLFRQYTQEVWQDVNGNVFAKVGSGEPTLLVMAHVDEIGMAVNGIEDNGMLRMVSVAGVDPRVLPGSEVRVYGKEALRGIVGAVPPHLLTSNEEAYKMEDLTIDLGLPVEKVRELVGIGDRITFLPDEPLELKNGFVSSKTMDDRALIAAELYCLELLKKRRYDCTVVMCASVNEEKTGLGAATGAYSVEPDMAVVMDVTHGKSACLPQGLPMDKVELTCGPNIHPKVFGMLKSAAAAASIPFEVNACMGRTGTDATDVQVSRGGVPTGLISPPLRYMHTNVETISIDTLKNCGKLLAEFITAIDADWRDSLCLDD